jgi:hypothetical protein
MRISLTPQEFEELLLSHHPNLPCFDDDVIILFKRRICAGCLLAYSTAAVVLFFYHPSGIESIFLSILFALLSQIRRLSKNLLLKHFSRGIAGIALGLGIGGGYWALMNAQWFMFILLMSGAILYLFLRANSLKKRLENCKKSSISQS